MAIHFLLIVIIIIFVIRLVYLFSVKRYKKVREFHQGMVMNRLVRLSGTSAFIGGIFFGILLYNFMQSAFDSSSCCGNNDDHDRYPQSRSVPRNSIITTSAIHFRYLNEYATAIDGWFSREILYVLWIVSQYQYEHLNLFAGIGEIGVHHGKFTCYLYLLRRYQEQNLFAVDVFDNQALNKDGSGRGQKDLFLRNIREYAQVFKNELLMYAGSSLDLNPIFSKDKKVISWWKNEVVDKRGLQLVSVDGGHTALLTYSDICLVSNGLADGGVVAVDDITHPGWLGVQDGTGRFLAETSQLLTDFQLEDEMAKMPNETNIRLSQRIVAATTLKSGPKSKCSRLVPFLQFFNKLFLTTPKYYPYYIELLGHQSVFANKARREGLAYLEYHALRLTIGNVPVWTNNHDYNATYNADIFKRLIEPDWLADIKAVDQRGLGPNTG